MYPHMIAADYAKVAKYNYNGFDTNGSTTNNVQGFGSAFTFVKTNAVCKPTNTAPGSTACIDSTGAVKQRWFSLIEGAAGVK